MTKAKPASSPDAQQPDRSKSLKVRPEVASALFGISKATLLRWEKERPDFPKPSRPTPRVTLYDRDKLIAYLDAVGVQGGTA
jgi:predicted DNA-binding transcriptional regulator AlpA